MDHLHSMSLIGLQALIGAVAVPEPQGLVLPHRPCPCGRISGSHSPKCQVRNAPRPISTVSFEGHELHGQLLKMLLSFFFQGNVNVSVFQAAAHASLLQIWGHQLRGYM